MTAVSLDPAALAILENTPDLLGSLLVDLPAQALETANPEGWTIRDIVGHLHDTEGIAFTERIQRMLREERPYIHSIDPPARLLEGGYAVRQLPDLLAELAEARAGHVAWLRSLRVDELSRTGEHDEAGEITPRDIVHQWAYHDLAHTSQIVAMLQARLVARMGNTRCFYGLQEV